MKSTFDKIRVYTNGAVVDGIGAYTYIVLESKDCGVVQMGEGRGRMFAPSVLKAKFAQAGKSTSEDRMKMRAVYEGVRHCPDNTEVEVYTDNFLIDSCLKVTKPNEEDGDIAERYRRYVAEHHISVVFCITKVYNEKDLPNNDHDEWTWWALYLCKDAIKRYIKENKITTKKDADIDTAFDELFGKDMG